MQRTFGTGRERAYFSRKEDVSSGGYGQTNLAKGLKQLLIDESYRKNKRKKLLKEETSLLKKIWFNVGNRWIYNLVKRKGEEMDLKVSIIVPVYKNKHLDRCIKSLVEQTYKNLQLILVNDGSTDGSLEICKAWGGRMIELWL